VSSTDHRRNTVNRRKQETASIALYHHHNHTTTILRPFYRDYPGETVPEEKLLINRGRHTDHPAGRHFIWTNQCPPPPSPFLQARCPSCRPSNSVKQRRQLAHSEDATVLLNGVTCTVCVPLSGFSEISTTAPEFSRPLLIPQIFGCRELYCWCYS